MMKEGSYLGNLSQLVRVRRAECTEGVERGLKIIEVDNGLINFDILESNCLDIGRLCYNGKNISFISKNGFGKSDGAFENNFCGGMLYTCGPESLGRIKGLPVHGSFHGLASSVKGCNISENGDINISAEAEYTALFGSRMKLERTISTKYLSEEIIIEDTLTNCGYVQDKYCLMYHINFGYPFLNKNTFIQGAIAETVPSASYAEEPDSYLKFGEPADGADERVYFHKLKDGRIKIINPDIGILAEIEWDIKALPCLIEWKSLASGDYALGIEPSTSFLKDKFAYSQIASGESKKFKIVLKFKNLKS